MRSGQSARKIRGQWSKTDGTIVWCELRGQNDRLRQRSPEREALWRTLGPRGPIFRGVSAGQRPPGWTSLDHRWGKTEPAVDRLDGTHKGGWHGVAPARAMLGCITFGPAAKGSMRKAVSRLDIYIFRQVLFALVMATGGLTALIWLTQSLRFVELVVNRGLSFFVFIHLTALLIPSFVAVILPITTYVVIQFVYQRMATDRELTVMRAAGLSPWALARPPLGVA
jgi:hypothetical protein